MGMTITQLIRSRIAHSIDQHLKGHGWGFFFDPSSSRPWYWLQLVRSSYALELQFGKWELVKDSSFTSDSKPAAAVAGGL